MSEVLAATDEIRNPLFLADNQQYRYIDSSDLEAFIRKSLNLENVAWIFPTISLLEKYSNLRAKFYNPKLRSFQISSANGESTNCYILEGIMEPSDIDAVLGNRKTELWIHKDRYVVFREIHFIPC